MVKSNSHQSIPNTRAGVIESGSTYTLKEFLERVNWKQDAYRTAKKNGLKTVTMGGRKYVLGDDFIDYARSQQAKQLLVE